MDPAWSQKSVGLVLMGCAIEEAIRTGHDEYDFLRGDEDYKFMWTTSTRQDTTVCLFDGRVGSQLARPHVWVREHVRQLIRRYAVPLFGLVTKN
jgi:CelD/BcsL family acetyltransferase involved in cellulose biosynthesis